jgi:hypothetical protein
MSGRGPEAIVLSHRYDPATGRVHFSQHIIEVPEGHDLKSIYLDVPAVTVDEISEPMPND